MRSGRFIDYSGIAALMAVVVLCAMVWRPVGVTPTPSRMVPSVDPAENAFPADSLSILASHTVARDPFRLDRRPSEVAFDPLGRYTPPPEPPPPPPKPALVLVGLVLGESPSAIVEGIPGHEGGTVIRLGEEIGGLLFERVRNDSAVVTGYDTLWVLGARGYEP